MDKATEHFEKDKHCYPKDQMSLVIMDTFKGQDNDVLKDLCAKRFCEVVIVPHSLTNKFHPLDISVNKVFYIREI